VVDALRIGGSAGYIQSTDRQHAESDARHRLLTDNKSNQMRDTGY